MFEILIRNYWNNIRADIRLAIMLSNAMECLLLSVFTWLTLQWLALAHKQSLLCSSVVCVIQMWLFGWVHTTRHPNARRLRHPNSSDTHSDQWFKALVWSLRRVSRLCSLCVTVLLSVLCTHYYLCALLMLTSKKMPRLSANCLN